MLMSGVAHPQAERRGLTLAVTMTNDRTTNQILVYDAESHVLLQTLSTRGSGGVGGNATRRQADRRLSWSPSSTTDPRTWRCFDARAIV